MKKEIKVTTKLVKQLHLFWPAVGLLEEKYWKNINKLEKKLEELTGIKDIEFFHSDGEIVGIGNAEKTIRLIHRKEIEENKIDKELNK
jgi:hypothetical protein